MRALAARPGAAATLTALVLLLLMGGETEAFKAQDFKKCADSSFCTRLRGAAGPSYSVDHTTVSVDSGRLAATIINEASETRLALRLSAYSGTLRLEVDEPSPHERFRVPDVLLPDSDPSTGVTLLERSRDHTLLRIESSGAEVTLNHRPFRLDVAGAVVVNGRGLFHLEHRRARAHPAAAGDDEEVASAASAAGVEGMWDETFRGHKDSKPKGPQGISLDVAFPRAARVYGLPEHASPHALRATRDANGTTLSDPYRLYNLDVFEYLPDSPFGLYGSIPFMLAHAPPGRSGPVATSARTVGMFWLNAAEMYIDVSPSPAEGPGRGGMDTQWVAESGALDVFFMLGPTPRAVTETYARLTGTTAMPPMFALGYHQCRWNYKDEADVAAVNAGFDAAAMPCDVIWLDIEHTDGKRYLTWDSGRFPDPKRMQRDVAAAGRRMVTIVDPHIKRDENYPLFREAEGKGYYVRNRDGGDFDGWCWPGASSYLDVVDPAIRSWWADQFALTRYAGSTLDLFIWNDMNEPSVFNGPEITMPKDAVHVGGVEHRDVHNAYGLFYHMATAEGLRRRGAAAAAPGRAGARPFVLSRAFFAGSQRVGAVWTGDNAANWEHLRVSVPMLLTLNVAGLPFSGSDVGGFFGAPEPPLLARWYQAAALTPFFRGHAHLDAPRREPWLFGEPWTSIIRAALRERYALLPYIYTLFRETNTNGAPIMRPLWFVFPEQDALLDVGEAFMLGDAILVAPVLAPEATSLAIPFPAGSRWYDGVDGRPVPGVAAGGVVDTPVSLDSMPRFYRGGHIVTRRERPRRSTEAQHSDPFTLVVALDARDCANGTLYLDDGETFAFEQGEYLAASVGYAGGELRYTPTHVGLASAWTVERVAVLGLRVRGTLEAQVVHGESGDQLEASHGPLQVAGDGQHAFVVRKVALPLDRVWSLRVQPV